MIDAINAAWPYVGPVLVLGVWLLAGIGVARMFNEQGRSE